MRVSDIDSVYLLAICVVVLSISLAYIFLRLHWTKGEIKALEQAIAHIALALETLHSEPESTEMEEKARSTSAIIGGIAGGGLGAIWGPVGVIAGSGIGSGIGNLAPEALEKAKAVVGNLKGSSVQSEFSPKKKSIFDRIPFFGK